MRTEVWVALIMAGPAYLALWLSGRRGKKIHAEVKSPNGQTTAEMVEEIKKDVKALRRMAHEHE